MKVNDKKNILLVEDEILIAMGKQQELEHYGYTVQHVNTGEKAVTLANENNEIDLILMDIDLGKGIDGTEAAALILNNHDIPIVFMSSHTEPEIVEKTEKITSYGYIVKNSSITVLDASIKMAFKLFDANKQIVESEKKYHNLFTNTDEGIAIHEMVLDDSGKPIDYIFLDVNEAFEKHTGLSKAEVLDKRVTEVIPDIEKSPFIKIYGEVVETGKSISFEQYSEQLKRYYSINAYRVASGQFATAFIDITKEIKLDEKFKKSEAYFQAIVQDQTALISRYKKDGTLLFVNSSYCEFENKTHNELVGSNFFDFIEKENIEEAKNQINKMTKSNPVTTHVITKKNSNGETRWFKWVDHMIFSTDGSFFEYQGIGYDITEQKQIENNLKTNLYYLTKAQEVGKIGTWELDLQTNISTWTDENYKIFGLPLGTKTTSELFLSYIHPDDRDYIERKWKDGFNNEPYDIEIRIIVDDKVKWIREKAEFKFDKKGNPISAIGVTQDITERKQAKQIADETTANLNSLINNRRESIWSIDTNYNYIILNDFFKEVYYKLYKTELKTGMKALGMERPDLMNFWKSKYDRALSGEEVIFEFASLIDNKLHFYETFLNPIITNKKVTGVTALSIDITERKQTEELIKQQLLEKEVILKESHHRIKNNFNSIVSLLSLQADSSDNTEVQSALNITKGRAQSMATLYEKMLLADNYQTIPVNEYLTSLTDNIINILTDKNIVFKKQIDNLHFDTKQLFYIGLIINELLTNMLKYAFPHRDSGLIELTLKEDKGEITLTIRDNGDGLPEGFDINKEKGFGLTLIRMLSEQLGGSFTIENKIGTTSIIKFPI